MREDFFRPQDKQFCITTSKNRRHFLDMQVIEFGIISMLPCVVCLVCFALWFRSFLSFAPFSVQKLLALRLQNVGVLPLFWCWSQEPLQCTCRNLKIKAEEETGMNKT